MVAMFARIAGSARTCQPFVSWKAKAYAKYAVLFLAMTIWQGFAARNAGRRL